MHRGTSVDSRDPPRADLTKAMQDLHSDLKLCGEPRNALFRISDDLLSYVRSLLRGESPIAPKASIEQWADLLSVLRPHSILPLLYWRIGWLPEGFRPPEPITDRMRRAFLRSRIHCLLVERQLGEILDAFRDEGVRTLVLRGPALAWSAYPDPVLRPCGDLDLLVLPEQMLQARTILERLGYRSLSKRFEVTRDFFREEDFIHQKNPRDHLLVDLHWVHWELHHPGVEEVFRRARKVESSVLTFETLHPVDALIHTAIHLAMIHNRDMRLIWIYDVALLARCLSVPGDWGVLQERSVASRARMALEHSLRMAQVWLGLGLPDGFDDFSNWPQPAEDERTIWSHAVGDHWVTPLLKRYLSGPSGLSEMIRPLFRLFFPPPDVVRYCYPCSRDWLLPLSYVRRWHRWFRELVVNRIGSS